MKIKLPILAITLLLFSGVASADQYNFEEAVKSYQALNIQQPKPEADGRIQTLNERGAMSPAVDRATKHFLDDTQQKKVLEIGGAYGSVMLKMLAKNPNIEYHINDIDKRHLFIAAHNLKAQVADRAIEKTAAEKVQFISGDISDAKFPVQEKYDAILIARVLHFLSPEQMDNAIANIASLLNENGKVYAVAITPYVKRYESFIPEYEKRLAAGQAYPGYVESLQDWLNVENTTKAQQASISKNPFMFLDDKVLTALFTKAGFKIIDCKTVPLEFASAAWALDGRENVILIAQK